MISKYHPLANFLKVSGDIYACTLQRVKEDSQARSKEDSQARSKEDPTWG